MSIYYFAYGSNMSPPQMARRCPGARNSGAGVLENWRLIITVRGTANIVTAPNTRVHGVLWRFENHHIGQMDNWEGVARRVYRRAWLPVKMQDGTSVLALTYICNYRWPGIARASYVITAMLPGARAAGLPDHYIDEIRGWLHHRPLAAACLYNGRRTPKPAARTPQNPTSVSKHLRR
ncbi:MAG TPA: gamma-glutamylcyclotransferase family protein [Hyphomicrobiaceae bacterium]|nr:gamma-glutamylcyclotransferase family protein [Hyphomicrobiaceae bacterium]